MNETAKDKSGQEKESQTSPPSVDTKPTSENRPAASLRVLAIVLVVVGLLLVLAGLRAVLFYGEVPGGFILGILLIVGGVYLSRQGKMKPPK